MKDFVIDNLTLSHIFSITQNAELLRDNNRKIVKSYYDSDKNIIRDDYILLNWIFS